MFVIGNDQKGLIMQPGARDGEYRTRGAYKPKASSSEDANENEGTCPSKHGVALLAAIRADCGALSPKLRTLAEFCLRNARLLHRMRIVELAAQTDNIPSTVVRFAKRYGYQGYNDFKLAFLEDSTLKTAVAQIAYQQAHQSGHDAAQRELEFTSLSGLALKDLVVTTSFQQAVRWVQGANFIGVLARTIDDRALAMHLELLLTRMGLPIVVLTEKQYLQGETATTIDVLLDIDIGLGEKSLDYGKVLPNAKTKFVRFTSRPGTAFSTNVMSHLGLFSYADLPEHLALAGMTLMNALCAAVRESNCTKVDALTGSGG